MTLCTISFLAGILPVSNAMSVGNINFGGTLILPEGVNNNVTMITDSVIVSVVFPESKINQSLDSFINNLEDQETQLVDKN